ncbi:protein neprosin-like [Aristolochia californica]|uniref:protein neprosin-like n=1 Tax=Aristolochia californica TaxID=171875 RepID=UPI0035D769D5
MADANCYCYSDHREEIKRIALFIARSSSRNLQELHGDSVAMARLMNISLFTLLLILAFVSHGFCDDFDVSVEEYVRMKKYLASVNKPPVTTITTKAGDVFDCVDINKQPSLDHPLLRNHTVQLEPPSFPPMKKLRPSSYISMMTEKDDEGCPLGTVPMIRVHMKDLLKFGSVENYNSKYGRSGYQPLGQGAKHQAMTINVWKPVINTQNNEVFSLAQLWVVNSGPVRNTIEAGWHVYPAYHGGSTETRLFIYSTADNYATVDCYNVKCGFVQVHPRITPGMILPKVSTKDGTQEEITISVYKANNPRHWWLGYEDSNGYVSVGYWPENLFNSLVNYANRITWGGETASLVKPGVTYAPMGSARFPSEGYRKAAYMRNMKVIDSSMQYVDAPSNLIPSTPTPQCYQLGDNAADVPTLGPHFYFGGPGGTC